MLKCQFHAHASGDPVDSIAHSPKELIRKAAREGYEVLAITCHRKIIFNRDMERYARKRGIIFLKSVEFEIKKMHILGINVNEDIYRVSSFAELAEYKTSHPDCMIIAAHPFFPGRSCLGKNLLKHLELFDAVENSFCYTKRINFNKKIHTLNKPIVATSDCHILKHLSLGYTFVEAKKDTTSIIRAVKAGKVKAIHKPLKIFHLCILILKTFWLGLRGRAKTPILIPVLLPNSK